MHTGLYSDLRQTSRERLILFWPISIWDPECSESMSFICTVVVSVCMYDASSLAHYSQRPCNT